MGFLVSQHGQLGAIPPPPFLSVSPLEYMRGRGAIPPPPKGYLSDTSAIPYENKTNGCDTPPCATISKGYCAIWGGISHWAAKSVFGLPMLPFPSVFIWKHCFQRHFKQHILIRAIFWKLGSGSRWKLGPGQIWGPKKAILVQNLTFILLTFLASHKTKTKLNASAVCLKKTSKIVPEPNFQNGNNWSRTWPHSIYASLSVYIYIYAYILIQWATFRLQKFKKQRERWKNKATKRQRWERRQNMETWKKTHTWCGGFSVPFFTIKLGKIEILTLFSPTDWGYGHIYIYISRRVIGGPPILPKPVVEVNSRSMSKTQITGGKRTYTGCCAGLGTVEILRCLIQRKLSSQGCAGIGTTPNACI